MTDILQEIKDGIRFFCSGQRIFFQDTSLWRYALLPLLLIGIIYLLVSIFVFGYIFPKMQTFFDNFFDNYQSVLHLSPYIVMIISGIVIALTIFFTISMLYQCFSSFTFDALSEFYEQKYYNFSNTLSKKELFALMVDGIIFSTRNFIISLAVIILPFIIPLLGHIVSILILGYLFAISCIQAAANNHGFNSEAIKTASANNSLSMTVFGTMAVLVLLPMPYLVFLISPGFIIGGCQMYNEKILLQKK